MTDLVQDAEVITDAPVAVEGGKPAREEWTKRFGTLTKLQVRTGRNGKTFATFAIDCKSFTQTGIAFRAEAIDALKAVGLGNGVWVKGPMEDVVKTGPNGASWTEQSFRAIYAGSLKKKGEGQAAAEGAEMEAAQADAPVDAGIMEDAEAVF